VKLKTSYNLTLCGMCLLVLLCLPFFSWGSDYDTLYKKANEQYRKAQYQDAVRLYTQILDGGYNNEAVYFNLGNTYFKLGDIPSALLYYEKAHKLAPGDEDINFNIYFANSKLLTRLSPNPYFLLRSGGMTLSCCFQFVHFRY
jgi:tetratricopeptide (TPR) repeat protein